MLVNLEKPALHDAVKRNTMRILSSINIPSRFEAHVMDLCFRYLEAPLEPVAIKAFSLKILGDFAKRYPEIVPEIKILIADQMDRQTAAFTQKAKKFLREF